MKSSFQLALLSVVSAVLADVNVIPPTGVIGQEIAVVLVGGARYSQEDYTDMA